LARCGRYGVDGLSAAEVSAAVLGELGDRSPASVRRYGCALRSFLRYCHLAGLIEANLWGSVLAVSGRRRSLLPQGISLAQERALLRPCDRRRATGRRDYAVIVLMLRLGLRASEVAALTLEDLNWRAGLITVHGKRARVDQRVRPPLRAAPYQTLPRVLVARGTRVGEALALNRDDVDLIDGLVTIRHAKFDRM